ncbi:hypothetical protein CAPTEDRAFT_203817 [Capitella teleta]|uniref:Uncharacterized protein n=1 Tax=Capitella teleta TaxID=283909 RepID=R7V2F9_CAPTE|nr:hypothetical protein CAPTEDRAFT_203817 [Capitella teleta]|eukprot:ELU13043.1 hypothetical protein CAPTEDRAFT_203817 [Capitella teleta]
MPTVGVEVRGEVEKVKEVVRVEIKRTSKGGEKKEGYGPMVYGLQKKEGRTNKEIIGDVLQVLGRKGKPQEVFRMRERVVGLDQWWWSLDRSRRRRKCWRGRYRDKGPFRALTTQFKAAIATFVFISVSEFGKKQRLPLRFFRSTSGSDQPSRRVEMGDQAKVPQGNRYRTGHPKIVEIKRTSKGGEKKEGYGPMVYGLQKKEGRTNKEIIGDVLQLDLSREEREVVKNKRVERKKQKEREKEEGGKSGGELSGRNRDGKEGN